MSTEITTFMNNELSVNIRTTIINDEPYFVGKDITEVLGYKNTRDALNKHVDQEDKADVAIHDGRQNRSMCVINESGLYSLILRSKLDSAKIFKRWVTSEVLPSIRKNGGYISNQENKTPEQILADALVVAQKVIAEREALVNKQQEELWIAAPKVEYHDKVVDSVNLKSWNEAAKSIGIGRNTMLKFLRAEKVLNSGNTPYQTYMDRGYFEVKTRVNALGYATTTTYVTGKGETWLFKFLTKHEQI